jgi:hypothetical protein
LNLKKRRDRFFFINLIIISMGKFIPIVTFLSLIILFVYRSFAPHFFINLKL